MKVEVDFPNEETDFRGAWSSTAGKLQAYRHAVFLVSTDAAWNFNEGNDKVAQLLRDLAKRLKEYETRTEAELDAYIKEADKRRRERP